MTDKTTADDTTATIEAARKEAATAAVKADRERRAAIMALDEAKGREALAEHLYGSTEMSVDEIKATLAASPKAEEKAPDPKAEYDAGRATANGAGLGDAPPAKPRRLATGMAKLIERKGAA